jgi:hypothetical protein
MAINPYTVPADYQYMPIPFREMFLAGRAADQNTLNTLKSAAALNKPFPYIKEDAEAAKRIYEEDQKKINDLTQSILSDPGKGGEHIASMFDIAQAQQDPFSERSAVINRYNEYAKITTSIDDWVKEQGATPQFGDYYKSLINIPEIGWEEATGAFGHITMGAPLGNYMSPDEEIDYFQNILDGVKETLLSDPALGLNVADMEKMSSGEIYTLFNKYMTGRTPEELNSIMLGALNPEVIEAFNLRDQVLYGREGHNEEFFTYDDDGNVTGLNNTSLMRALQAQGLAYSFEKPHTELKKTDATGTGGYSGKQTQKRQGAITPGTYVSSPGMEDETVSPTQLINTIGELKNQISQQQVTIDKATDGKQKLNAQVQKDMLEYKLANYESQFNAISRIATDQYGENIYGKLDALADRLEEDYNAGVDLTNVRFNDPMFQEIVEKAKTTPPTDVSGVAYGATIPSNIWDGYSLTPTPDEIKYLNNVHNHHKEEAQYREEIKTYIEEHSDELENSVGKLAGYHVRTLPSYGYNTEFAKSSARVKGGELIANNPGSFQLYDFATGEEYNLAENKNLVQGNYDELPVDAKGQEKYRKQNYVDLIGTHAELVDSEGRPRLIVQVQDGQTGEKKKYLASAVNPGTVNDLYKLIKRDRELSAGIGGESDAQALEEWYYRSENMKFDDILGRDIDLGDYPPVPVVGTGSEQVFAIPFDTKVQEMLVTGGYASDITTGVFKVEISEDGQVMAYSPFSEPQNLGGGAGVDASGNPNKEYKDAMKEARAMYARQSKIANAMNESSAYTSTMLSGYSDDQKVQALDIASQFLEDGQISPEEQAILANNPKVQNVISKIIKSSKGATSYQNRGNAQAEATIASYIAKHLLNYATYEGVRNHTAQGIINTAYATDSTVVDSAGNPIPYSIGQFPDATTTPDTSAIDILRKLPK